MLKGTPYEGGRNWPKITLTMREEGLGSKPLAEAVQAVLLEHLNMKTDLEVLEQRVFRGRALEEGLQLVWIRWFMDYPGPAQRVLRHVLRQEDRGQAPGLGQRRLRQGARVGPRHPGHAKKRMADYAKAEEIMQTDGGYVPVAWVARWAAAKPQVRGWRRTSWARPSSRATSTSTCSRTSISWRKPDRSGSGGARGPVTAGRRPPCSNQLRYRHAGAEVTR